MICAPEQHGGKVPVPEITSHIRLLIRDRGQMHFVVGRIRGLERSRLPQAVRNRPCRRVFRSSLAELQTEKDSMADEARRLLVNLSLLKIRSERKSEQARERKSFGWKHAGAAAIEIGHRFQPN